MRWLRAWWRRPNDDTTAAAIRAESERKLEEVQRMGPKVAKLARELDGELAVNNFAALVESAFRQRRP